MMRGGEGVKTKRAEGPSNADHRPIPGPTRGRLFDSSVDSLERRLSSNPSLTVTPATKVQVGGLSGVRLDVEIAPVETTYPSDCPVTACVTYLKGRDPSDHPTWDWEWGTVSSERDRLYLLTAKDGVVLILVGSADGTTFDPLTKAADAILANVKFDTR
jgi:hypothetical protein